jgi:hypothetical protein
MAQLINIDTARQHIPNSRDQDEPVINALIDNASKAIQKFCRRDFISTTYDELYDGPDDPVLILRQYPIISIQSVRTGLETVLEAQNNSTSVQQARISVTSTAVLLKRVASGTATSNTLTFAANVTLTAMATAITAVANGWTGRVASSEFNNYPSADLLYPQGAFDAKDRYAGLKLHTEEVATFEIDERNGFLVASENVWEEGPVWERGTRNYRVQYTAGYSTIPEDVQKACAELVASWFANRGRDVFLSQENIKGSNSYSAEPTVGQLPGRLKALLRPYRNYRV